MPNIPSFDLHADVDSVFVNLAGLDPVLAARMDEEAVSGDVVDFSEEAMSALATMKSLGEARTKAAVNHALSLPQISARIETVRAEIAEVWSSALPDEDKHALVSVKENEIALLQAGQFDFGRAGLSWVA